MSTPTVQTPGPTGPSAAEINLQRYWATMRQMRSAGYAEGHAAGERRGYRAGLAWGMCMGITFLATGAGAAYALAKAAQWL